MLVLYTRDVLHSKIYVRGSFAVTLTQPVFDTCPKYLVVVPTLPRAHPSAVRAPLPRVPGITPIEWLHCCWQTGPHEKYDPSVDNNWAIRGASLYGYAEMMCELK